MHSWFENYRVSTRDAVKIRFVNGFSDLRARSLSLVIFDEKNSADVFKPRFTHQIFGCREQVFGYRKVTISLLFCQQSLYCHYVILKKEKIPRHLFAKADNIDSMIKYFIPPDCTKDVHRFRTLTESYNLERYGTLIHYFRHTDGLNYAIHRVDVKSENFFKFFARLETLIFWYIDGANKIDLKDPNWTIYMLYRDTVVVGYCTVYKFDLDNGRYRKRISQFFIMPPQQRLHLGTVFLRVVYNELLLTEMAEVSEVIVELPCEEFQSLKDFLDMEHVFAGTEYILKLDELARTRLHELKTLYNAENPEDFKRLKRSILSRIYSKSKNLKMYCDIEMHPEVLIEQYMNTLRHYARTCQKFAAT